MDDDDDGWDGCEGDKVSSWDEFWKMGAKVWLDREESLFESSRCEFKWQDDDEESGFESWDVEFEFNDGDVATIMDGGDLWKVGELGGDINGWDESIYTLLPHESKCIAH